MPYRRRRASHPNHFENNVQLTKHLQERTETAMPEEATVKYSAATKKMGDKIVELTLKQAKELSDYLENEHGIKAAAGGTVMVAGPEGADSADTAEVQTEFDVVLESYGEKKINVIKVVRANTDLGLRESKDLVEGSPNKVKESISKEDAEKLKAELEEAGATVSIK